MGARVSAPQIMELRYYSRDWAKYSDPRAEYLKTFTQPTLWAWSGAFDDSSLGTTAVPGVRSATLFDGKAADSFEHALSVGATRYGQQGTQVDGGTPAFPTLIQELSSVVSYLDIKWPVGSATTPYVFRTFRAGQNKIYIMVRASSSYAVYAANISKHPQGGKTDEEFIQYLLDNYPDDIDVGEASLAVVGTIFTVELEYQPALNHIKVFTYKPNSADGSMYTASTYVSHKFYHAHLAQTSFSDRFGVAAVEPWVDRFLDFDANVSIKQLSKNVSTPGTSVLWDSVAYYRPTIFPVQKAATETLATWEDIYCGVVALTLSNVHANSVQPWTVTQGSQTALNLASTVLGIVCDRSANPNLPVGSPTIVAMSVVSKSVEGIYHPANVIFVRPTTGAYSFDKRYDRFVVTFAYTEYKQGPVGDVDRGDLKYPTLYSNYITSMPYKVEMNTAGDSFSVSGLSFPYYQGGVVQGYLRVTDFEDALSRIERSMDQNERKALESFAAGGDKESELVDADRHFRDEEASFNAKYDGMVFDGGAAVSLPNFCALLDVAGYYEGTQEYRVVFKDETGRPIGVKRVALLLQSAYVSPRDVEIYYKWRTQAAFVDPRDHTSLLARDYKPMVRSTVLMDYFYEPKCGDHNLQTAGQTFYVKFVPAGGESINWLNNSVDALRTSTQLATDDSGPLWYPYKACSTPRYHEDDPLTKAILCATTVEGFYTSKRRDYWEKMRGPDIYWAVRLGLQDFIGCTWSWVEGDYQTIKDPVFAGFTRIRSGHLLGPYQTDREGARLSRHYSKKNLTVRNEWVRTEGYNGSQTLSSEGTARLFDANGNKVAGEKPVWLHCFDDLSVVNRTTSQAKHPFSNVLLTTSADHTVNETFDPTRRLLASVLMERHLIKEGTRDSNGNIVYNPTEPLFVSSDEGSELTKGKDVFWVFKKGSDVGLPDNIAWAWLEIAKNPVRAVNGTAIGGVFVYNPSVNGFKKNMASATFMPDGTYPLVYTAPRFTSNGTVASNPTLAWAGGPPREINWLTGIVGGAPSSWGADPYNVAAHVSANGASFQLFGKVTGAGNGFLADSSGLHTFETSTGRVETFRGISVRPDVLVSLLPLTEVDALLYNSAIRSDIQGLSSVSSEKTYTIELRGSKTLRSFQMRYILGPDTSAGKSFSLPQVALDGLLPTGIWVSNIAYLVAKGPTTAFTSGTQTASMSGRYTKVRIRVGRPANKTYNGINELKLYIGEPTSRTEYITVYNQAVNVSYGDLGNRYASDLLYYYGRTFADFGLSDVNYEEDINNNGPFQQDLKWQSRTAKDVLIYYHFMDPTGTVFNYPKAPTASLPDIKQAAGGAYYIDKSLDIHTKGQTVITNAHVDDPIDAQTSGLTWSSTLANNETSTCLGAVSEGILDEGLQECLYSDAGRLLRTMSTVYTSFWHPDEVAFFTAKGGLTEMPTWTLTVRSTLPPLSRVMRHQTYGGTARYTTEYFDGRVHAIPPWRALGHLLYLGRPVWNWSCTAIIMQKISSHLGETLFERHPPDYVASRTWPVGSYTNVKVEAPDFYSDNPKYWDNPATYVGGTMSVGIPTNISQALNYAPGGTPRGWLEELSAFPQSKSWPLGATDVVSGFKK